MRRIAATFLLVVGAAALLFVGQGASGDDGGAYEVRAIFDTGGFVVPGEEVRVAGASVGTISEVDVTGADEIAHEDGSTDPGSAVVVLEIDDPGFRDFREDASCVIRPQSLLGEKFVECNPTQPRAAGSEIPPELGEIPDGEPGEGQLLLPLERNRKAVDLDLLNNIMEEPYPDRFRLILNELGAGLATRGEDLAEVIVRADPALQQTNEVLEILGDQSRELEQLAAEGDRSLVPLARERERVSGFINSANQAAEATAERRDDLEEGLQKLPGFLREVRLTMPELQRFTDEATPTFAALGDAAPFITRATVALEPFADAANTSFQSLGDATEEAGPDIAGADPILVDIRDLAEGTQPAARDLNDLLRSTRERNGFDYIMRLIYNGVGIANGYDSFGHFLRAFLPFNNCVDYTLSPSGDCSGTFFTGSDTARAAAVERATDRSISLLQARQAAENRRSEGSDEPRSGGASEQDAGPDIEPSPDVPLDPSLDGEAETELETTVTPRDQAALLEFLLGSGQSQGGSR